MIKQGQMWWHFCTSSIVHWQCRMPLYPSQSGANPDHKYRFQ